MEQRYVKIYARFDLEQDGNRLDWEIVDSSNNSLYKKNGPDAGSVVLPPGLPVRLEIIGHSSTTPQRKDPEPAFLLEGIALTTVPRGTTRISSPFKTRSGAVLSFGPDQFQPIEVAMPGAYAYGYELRDGAKLQIDEFNGRWELSLLATVRRGNATLAQQTVLRFDPEVKVGAGNNPPT